MKSDKNYLQIADDCYNMAMVCYNGCGFFSGLAVYTQYVATLYLRHIVDAYGDDFPGEESTLHEHTLRALRTQLHHWVKDFDIDANMVRLLDGYYYTCRYPRDEYRDVEASERDECLEAIKYIHDLVHKYEDRHNKHSDKIVISSDLDEVLDCWKNGKDVIVSKELYDNLPTLVKRADNVIKEK